MYWELHSQCHKHTTCLSPIEAAWPSAAVQACGSYVKAFAYNKDKGCQSSGDFTYSNNTLESAKVVQVKIIKGQRRS